MNIMKNQRNIYINTTSYTDLYYEAQRRYNELVKIRNSKETSLEKAPPGKIHIVKKAHSVQYYLRKEGSEKTGRYISKSEISTIKQLLQKSYDEKILKLVTREIQILNKLLTKSENTVSKIQRAYSDYPIEVKNHINPIDSSDADYAQRWLSVPYEGKTIPEDVAFFETKRQERVRSKSELTIANALADNGIPYKYECPLQLRNGLVFYPDFTVLNVKKRKVFYWEHRGMMDDKEYATSSVLRLKTMMKEGFFVGKELIITEETSANPLGTSEIEGIIKKFFLN